MALIAIPARGRDLDALMASDLGAAPYLLIVDTTTGELDVLVVDTTKGSSKEPGERAADLLVDRSVDLVLAGDVDLRATARLEVGGVEVRRGHAGIAREAVKGLSDGSPTGVDECFCPNCGYAHHRTGTRPCYQRKCPECGGPMDRRWVTAYKYGEFLP